METSLIIVGIIGFALFYFYLQRKKQLNTSYFKIKNKLEEDLTQANFSGDWKLKQEINLKLLWLEAVRKVESNNPFQIDKEKDQTDSLLAQLSDEDIKFPKKWKLADLYHFPFSQEIVASYGKTLEENDYKGLYKPESILSLPKDIIKKAIYFTFDYLNLEKPLYEIPDKQKLADNLNTVKFVLIENFVDTSQKNLPKDGIENLRVGQQLREAQPYNELDDLSLIDWRGDLEWVVAAIKYGDADSFEFALACIEKAKVIDPESKHLKGVEGLLYKYMAEYYENNNDKESAIKFMKMADSLKYG